MDIFIYRSLIFALIEFGLAGLVLYKGKFQRIPIALTLTFLGGYQLGEFIFLSSGSTQGIQFALFSTTLLPPFGMLILERVRKKIWLYPAFQIFGAYLAILFLLDPGIYQGVGDQFCLVKLFSVSGGDAAFIRVFFWYYTAGLTIPMILAIKDLINEKRKAYRKFYWLYLLAYSSFFPVSVILVTAVEPLTGLLPSTMCALAIIAAFIMAWMGVNFSLKTDATWWNPLSLFKRK